MDFRSLELFLSLANSLHFARTAEACHLSPSALSRQIQRLEENLGCRLFERDNRRVQLTSAGQAARRHAEIIVERCREMEQDLRGNTGSLRGELSLYCSVTASHSLLSELLAEWRRRQPQVDIKLHTGDEAHAVARVLRGEEDVAIAARPDQLPDKLRFQQLASTPLVFIAPRQESGAQDWSSGLDAAGEPEWARLPLILPETGQARRTVDDWYHARGLKPSIYAQVSGNEAIVSMVSLGFGIGIVPLLVLRKSPIVESVRVLDVDHPPPAYSIGLCTLRRRHPDPLVEKFWQLAAELQTTG
jgi:LysR family positive regulator for ilvC